MEISTAAWDIGGQRVIAAAGSVIGTRYGENYDVLYMDTQRPLALVADGMGDGHGSSIAGRTAVQTFIRHAAAANDPIALRSAVAEVHRAVRAAGRGLPELTGCTITALVGGASDAEAWLVHLGDSRAYRLREGLLELLTVDHTMAWLDVLNGRYALDSPEGRSGRRRLTRYAGHPAEPDPDVLNVSLHPGDRLLLCTDGVCDNVNDQYMAHMLEEIGNPKRAAEALLNESTDGDDNATALLLRVL